MKHLRLLTSLLYWHIELYHLDLLYHPKKRNLVPLQDSIFLLLPGDKIKMDSQNLALLERLFAAFNWHDADKVMACFSPEIIFDAIAGPEAVGRRIIGLQATRDAFVNVWTTMPDVQWNVRRHAVFGNNRGLTEWLFTATTAQGGRIEAEGIDLFSFKDGLIIHKNAFRKDRPIQPAT